MKTGRQFVLFLLLFAGFAIPAPVSGATYYVAKTGHDANSGTLSLPFLTVQKALDLAQPGDVVRIGPGTYAEDLSTTISGRPGAPIVLDGQNDATVRQVNLGHEYISLVNTRITGITQAYSRLLYLKSGAHHCIISNNVINANDALKVYGVQFATGDTLPFDDNAPSYNLLVSNTVENVLGTSMLAVGGNHNRIQGNRVQNGGQVDFLRLFGRSNYIVGNFFSNNYTVEGVGNHPDFVQTFGNNGVASFGHIIEGNVVRGIEGGQLTQLEGNLLPETGNWLFCNNLFIDIALQASCTIPNIKYYNNTFVRCNTVNGGHALSFGGRYYDGSSVYSGATGTNWAHGARVINNIFLDCGDSTFNKGWYAFNADLTDVVADYNYVGKVGFSKVDEDAEQRYVGDPRGWSTFDWWEPHGINGGDPGLVGATTGLLSLRPESPLIDQGRSLGEVETDYAGNVRGVGGGYDIGAYEFYSGTTTITRPGRVTGLRVAL
jgi:hypothetical protein